MVQPTTRAFLAAYLRGRRTAQVQAKNAVCPYLDKRTNYRRGVTFSQAFRTFWQEGYDDERAGRPVKYAASERERNI